MPYEGPVGAGSSETPQRLHALEGFLRATLNLLEDFDEEKAKLSLLNRAMINLLEDSDDGRRASELAQKATLNLLEDMNDERDELDRTQRALLNMLEDVDVERDSAERARTSLEGANQALRERSLQLRALASELTMAEQRERRRLAHTLHDGLQQMLVGAKMRLEILATTRSSDVWREVEQVGELIAESIKTSRLLTTELSPPILYAGGLVPALESLVRWMGEQHRLAVDLTVPGRIQDPEQDIAVLLYQATRELLFNVVKHARVKTAAVEVRQVENLIEIAVADHGVGFDPSNLRAEGGKHGGFGLFSIRERFDLVGGAMQIHSAPGQGCRFTLIAPRTTIRGASGDPPGQESTALAAPASSRSDAAIRGRKIRIVLVDDHPVVRQGVAYLLSREQDMELVGEACDGETGVTTIRDLHPDVVLMDIGLPGLNGIEATRIVHSLMPDVRIIGFSMFEEPDPARAIREAGAVAFLTKTSRSEVVLSTIRACFYAPAS